MKQIVCISSLVLLTSCASVSLETIEVPVKLDGWKVGNSQDVPGKGNIVEFIQEKENINAWTKIATIQFLENNNNTPSSVVSTLEKSMKKKCQNVKWNILEESSNSVLYEWSLSKCSTLENQHELSRFLKGNDGLHRVAYTEKGFMMSAKTRNYWIDKLSKAQVIKNGKKVSLN
jgi:hypothetical protein